MLVLAGGSGAGKTRLALEASLMARARGMRPLAGECLPLTSSQPDGHRLQATPLGPLAGVVQAIADACLEGGKQATSKLLGEGAALLAGHFPALAALPGVADLPEPPALTGDAARVRFLTAISDTLKAFAAERPVLLLVDDLQWADELTVAFLEHLGSGSLRQMRLMVVGTLRTDEAETVLLTRIRKTADRRLDVGRMSGSEVSHLLGGMLAMPHPPRGLVDFLVNHTDGNPFFVTQYLRMAVAEQMLVRDRAGRWTLAEGVAEDAAAYESLPLPRSLREVIELRLQRLSPGSLVVLKVAAILGRRFDLDVLASVVDADESAVLAAVDEMALRQVIESDDAGGFHLTHDRLRENVLAGLGETDRRRLHQRVAEFFEARLAAPSPSGEANHAELGYHWSEAGMPAKAVGYLRLAGDRAQALYAADQAIELYRAALEQARLAGDDARVGRAERRELQEKLGDVLALRGQRERARDAYAQALTQAQPEENVVRARLHRKQGKTWETDHDHERALAAYESAYGALGECPETTAEWRFESMQAALDRIWVYYWLVRVDQMNAELERIRPEVEERGLPLQRYHYHMCVALRDFRHERYRVSDATLEHARQMLAAAREADSLAEIAFARFVRGFGLLFAGHLNEAEAELMESRELCRRIGDVSSETRAAAYLVLVHRRSGRVEAARCEGELLLAQARERKMDDYRGVAEAALGWAALRQGDVTAAAEWSQSAIETWKGLSFPYPFQWCAALTLLKLQLHQAPLRQLIALVQLLQNPAQLRLPDEIEAAFSAAIAAREDGDQQGVGEALDRALGQAQRLGYL